MAAIQFHKYQGTGNDFIMIDDRDGIFPQDNLDLIGKLCDRKFGIGADGVILIRNHPDFDFEMVYFNPDGTQSLCGNGSRCALKFASYLEMIDQKANFMAVDGPHEGSIEGSLIHIKMTDVSEIVSSNEAHFVDTGSPHYVKFVDDLNQVDVFHQGREIRYSPQFGPGGTNVNFVQPVAKALKVRTYERGVENETLSCGTGVTAVALVSSLRGYHSPVTLDTPGGSLQVAFKKSNQGDFSEVYLIGPAEQVFSGSFKC